MNSKRKEMSVGFGLVAWLIINLCVAQPAETVSPPLKWEGWSQEAFARAKKENRLVLLDLEAVWCHWCHVMEKNTYSNPAIAQRLRDKFVLLKVDQDSRPDLSNHYEDYGWPATVIFDASGRELAVRSGYIPPEEMLKLIDEVEKNPKPEEKTPGLNTVASVAKDGGRLGEELRSELEAKMIDRYDHQNQGWGVRQKFLSWDNVEYCLLRARRGDQVFEQMARGTLNAERKIMDPVWGGAYQYSTDGDWDHPHFEKIMSVQAGNLRVYSQAYLQWGDAADLATAKGIRDYLKNFLTSPDGAFYTSQDADVHQGEHSGEYFKLDDAHRRALGMPRIDRHIYARENGWAIEALTYFYAASRDPKDLNAAMRAAEWIVAHRSLPGGGFSHDEHDAAGPYLGDTLAMGRAFLALYGATADSRWLDRAQVAADFIDAHFRAEAASGFATSEPKAGDVVPPVPELDENVQLARFVNLLFHYTAKPVDLSIAHRAMYYVTDPVVARDTGWITGNILLADFETASEPDHFAIVGGRGDPTARALFEVVMRSPNAYKEIEWIDPAEKKASASGIEYPAMDKAAAYVCKEQRCSAPVFTEKDLAELIQKKSTIHQ